MTRSPELAGLAVGCCIVILSGFVRTLIAEPAWLLLALSVLASVSGVVVSLLNSQAGIDISTSVRRGVRAAAISGIVAASVFALMARNMNGPSTLNRALLAGLLSILPAVLCGTFAAGIGAIVRARASTALKALPSNDDALPRSAKWAVQGLVAILVLLAVMLPPGQDPFEKRHISIAAKSAPAQPQPPPPPFDYATPPEMATAHALQWKLGASKDVIGVNAETIVLSEDEQWLGYVSNHGNSLCAVELSSAVSKHQVSLPHPVDRLAFSPDAKRLFVATNRGQMEIGVVDLLAKRYIVLPKPRNRAMPDGMLSWWQEKEVLIVGSSGNYWILNLDTLEVDEANAVESWKNTEPIRRSLIISHLTGNFSESPRWAWESDFVPKSVALPEELGAQDWTVEGAMHLAIRHPEREVRRTFEMISLENQDRLLSMRDGSKVIRIRGDSLRIYYFEITSTPPFKWTLAMPQSPSEGPDAARIETALKDGTLCAFVYGRVINPLTNELVGPDREDVRGSMNVLDWKGEKMTVYASEYLGSLDMGNVVADLHVRSGQQRGLLKLNAAHRWWTELGNPVPNSDHINAVPTRAEKAKQFVEVRESERKKAKEKAEAEQQARESERLAAKSREDANRKTSLTEQSRLEQEAMDSLKRSSQPMNIGDPVKDFIIAHHRKSEIGDAQGMATDYADRVDYFTDGLVDPQHIFKDELRYHTNHRVEEESVQGDIRVTRLNNSSFTATYLIIIKSVDLQKNTLSEALFEENLIIIQSPTGLKITRQRAEKKQ